MGGRMVSVAKLSDDGRVADGETRQTEYNVEGAK